MKSPRRFAIITVSVLLLGAGVVLGFLPVRATLTQIAPELRLVTVSCGNGYLQATPPVQPGDLVALPGESGVYLPRATYTEHCGEAAGWKRYAAWGLTALGALGLAITFSSAGPAPRPVPRGATGSNGAGARSADAPTAGTDAEMETPSRNGSDSGGGQGSGPFDTDGEVSEPADASKRRSTHEAGATRGRHALREDTDS